MNETRRHHGFALVCALLASASFQVAAPDADWSRVVTIFLGAAILRFVGAARATSPPPGPRPLRDCCWHCYRWCC